MFQHHQRDEVTARAGVSSDAGRSRNGCLVGARLQVERLLGIILGEAVTPMPHRAVLTSHVPTPETIFQRRLVIRSGGPEPIQRLAIRSGEYTPDEVTRDALSFAGGVTGQALIFVADDSWPFAPQLLNRIENRTQSWIHGRKLN